jgi:tRNA(Met) cytidine acetyltransferase
VIAAALVALEGQITGQLADDIIAGKRRPQGNLLPQSIASITGNKANLSSTYARVVRIAVNPYCQGANVGTQLLNHIEKDLVNKVDYIGASFGAEVKLLNFWQRQAYRTVKIGLKQDKASGEHSCIVLKKMTSNADIKHLTNHFTQLLFCELARSMTHLPSELVFEIITNLPLEGRSNTLNDETKRLLTHYTNFNSIRYLLLQQIQLTPSHLMHLEKGSRKLLIKLVLQGIDETSVIKALNLTGKKQLNSTLKNAVQQWCAI